MTINLTSGAVFGDGLKQVAILTASTALVEKPTTSRFLER